MLPEPLSNDVWNALAKIRTLNAFERIQVVSELPREELRKLRTVFTEITALIDGDINSSWVALYATMDRDRRRASLQGMTPQQRVFLIGQLDKLLDETKAAQVIKVIDELLTDALSEHEQ